MALFSSTRQQEESKFLVYSLRSHQILKSIGIHNSISFMANERFIVVVSTFIVTHEKKFNPNFAVYC